MHDPLTPDGSADIDLQKSGPVAPARATGRGTGPGLLSWVVVVVLVVAGGLAAYLLIGGRTSTAPEVAELPAAPVASPVPVERPLGPEVEPIDLPPLPDTDALVRSLVQGLSNHPRVVAWLASDQLIRNFTVVVDNIATGQNPSPHLRVLRSDVPFEVTARAGGPVVNPVSYERYASMATAIGSIDPAGAARLYAMLKPRIEDASRELGHTQPFDRLLERALLVLLETPVLDGDVTLVAKGGIYQYADPRLEALSPAQKQLARMGPRNARAVQARLQEIALALGIRAERLAD